MEKAEFIDVRTPGWWLLDVNINHMDLERQRRELGARWGWEDPEGCPIDQQWFTKEDNVRLVFESLESSEFMTQLDAMLEKEREEGGSVDASARLMWLEKVVQAKTPVEKPPADKTADPVQAKVEQPPVAPPPPVKKVSAFGPKTEAAEPAQAEQPAAAQKPGLFDKKKAVRAEEPASPVGAAAAGAAQEEAAAASPEPPPPRPSAEAVRAVVDIPQAEEVLSKAELDEALQDPMFEEKFAEAMRKLDAELAAAESGE
jgi:hypothetical protein